MCLIIARPTGAKLPSEESLENAHHNNSDGFGIVARIDNRLECAKTLGGAAEIQKLISEYKDLPAILHWRFCTNGPVTLDNVHPFQVAQRDKHGLDVYVAHNGVIQIPHEKNESDTVAFLRQTVKPMMRHGAGLIHLPAFKNLMAMSIGSGSKLAIISSDAKFSLVNEGAGHWDKDTGCWLSNSYSLESPYKKYKAGAWKGWDDNEYDAWQNEAPRGVYGTPASAPALTANKSTHEAPLPTAEEIQEALSTDIAERVAAGGMPIIEELTWQEIQELCWDSPDTVAELLWNNVQGNV